MNVIQLFVMPIQIECHLKEKIYCATNVGHLLMLSICVNKESVRHEQIVLFYRHHIAIVKFLHLQTFAPHYTKSTYKKITASSYLKQKLSISITVRSNCTCHITMAKF